MRTGKEVNNLGIVGAMIDVSHVATRDDLVRESTKEGNDGAVGLEERIRERDLEMVMENRWELGPIVTMMPTRVIWNRGLCDWIFGIDKGRWGKF
jgi:hypothetical protein